MAAEKPKKKTEKQIKLEREKYMKELLKEAKYCPRVSGQSWAHVGRD